jgi:S1-C subfamily serine protease
MMNRQRNHPRKNLSFARGISLVLPALSLFSPADTAPYGRTSTANELFTSSHQCVFQIRVIDNSSGKKSAIGSGFSISGDGLLATNYHVVANAITKPNRYRLEYVAFDGKTGSIRAVIRFCVSGRHDSRKAAAFFPSATRSISA